MKDIDKMTAGVVKFIDEIKVDIMKESGEDVSQGTMNDKLKIIWGKFDASKPCLPIRMNLDAINSKVIEATNRGIPNVYNAVITDKDDTEVTFNVSNNVQSSSVLEFGTHSYEHPQVVYVDKTHHLSITVDTFFERNNLDASKYDFWNFDIQGAELMALKGATKSIKHAKAIYLEVNEKELYKNCGLISDIDTFLAQHNFKRVLTNMTQHGWGDALYIIDN